MKISELIMELETVRDSHGDIDVVCSDDGEGRNPCLGPGDEHIRTRWAEWQKNRIVDVEGKRLEL